MTVVGGVDIDKFSETAGHIRVYQSFIDIGFNFLLSPFMVMLLDHMKRALSQYTAHFYLITLILEDIYKSSDCGLLSLYQMLTYLK